MEKESMPSTGESGWSVVRKLLGEDLLSVVMPVYRLAETEIAMSDHKELLLLFVNRSYIHAVPKRCLGDKEILDFKAYFEEKGLI